MKLRSIICVSAVAAAMAASALETSNTFARMPVDGASGYTLLGIPLAGCGESSPEIYVTNLVMTTGLANGTKLLYKDGNTIYAWQISGGNWVALDTSTTVAGLTATPSASSAALPCGKGCWLYLASPTTVYMFGQKNEGAVTTDIAAGTSTQWTYTLVSRPYELGEVNLATWAPESPAAGDTITVNGSVAGQKTYKYVAGTGWTTNAVTITGSGKSATYTYEDVHVTDTIPAGTAFLYGRARNAAATTINWSR